jgi:hypothetical protein
MDNVQKLNNFGKYSYFSVDLSSFLSKCRIISRMDVNLVGS